MALAAAKMKGTTAVTVVITFLIAVGSSAADDNAGEDQFWFLQKWFQASKEHQENRATSRLAWERASSPGEDEPAADLIKAAKKLEKTAIASKEYLATLKFGPSSPLPVLPVLYRPNMPVKQKPEPEPEPEPEPVELKKQPVKQPADDVWSNLWSDVDSDSGSDADAESVKSVKSDAESVKSGKSVKSFGFGFSWSGSESGESEIAPQLKPDAITNATRDKLCQIIESLKNDVSKTLNDKSGTSSPDLQHLLTILNCMKTVYSSEGGELSELAIQLGKARQLKSLWERIKPTCETDFVQFQPDGNLKERLESHYGTMTNSKLVGRFDLASTGHKIVKDCFDAFLTGTEVPIESAELEPTYNLSTRRCSHAHLGMKDDDPLPLQLSRYIKSGNDLPCQICYAWNCVTVAPDVVRWNNDYFNFNGDPRLTNEDMVFWNGVIEQRVYELGTRKFRRGMKVSDISFSTDHSAERYTTTMADPTTWSENGAAMFVAILSATVVFFVVLSMLRLLRWRRSLQSHFLERNSSTK